jgi:hypothetical protein
VLLSSCGHDPIAGTGIDDPLVDGDSVGAFDALVCETRGDRYAKAVVESWIPTCSLQRNAYSDLTQVLGPPDAANLGGRDQYRGLLSLGQAGHVTVDMGRCVTNGPGDDVRIYQATSSEPVNVYVSAAPSGPFVLLDYRRSCGSRSPGLFSNHCDFDLAGSGLAEARYVRVEDGEIYPCLSGGTVSEGADIDAIEILN